MTDERDSAREDDAADAAYSDAVALLINHMRNRPRNEQAACQSGFACAMVEVLWMGRRPGAGIPETLALWNDLGRAFIENAPAVWPASEYPPGVEPGDPPRVTIIEPNDPKGEN